MSVSFRYTTNDYIAAGRLHLKTPLRKNYPFWVFLIAACIIATIMPRFWYFPLAWIAVEVGLNVLQNYILVPYSIKRQLKQNPTIFSTNTNIAVNDEGLTFKNERTNVNVAWTDIYRWKHNEHYLLLYLTSRFYYIVPQHLQAQGLDISHLLNKLNDVVGRPR